MIEILLEAERAMTAGRLDLAERLYTQTLDADPRNSIAAVGLARVALERGDDRAAFELAGRALAIDPENVAARRLLTRMAEVLRTRGELADLPAAPSRAPAQASPAEAANTGVSRRAPRLPGRRSGLIGRILGGR